MKRLYVLMVGILVATLWVLPFDVWSMGSRAPFIDQEGHVQEYVKGGVLTEQRIDETVTRIQKQEPGKAAAPRSLHRTTPYQ